MTLVPVWIVVGGDGSYSGRAESPVLVFYTEAEAIAFKEMAERLSPKMSAAWKAWEDAHADRRPGLAPAYNQPGYQEWLAAGRAWGSMFAAARAVIAAELTEGLPVADWGWDGPFVYEDYEVVEAKAMAP